VRDFKSLCIGLSWKRYDIVTTADHRMSYSSSGYFHQSCHVIKVQVQVQVKNLVVPHHYKNAGPLQLSHKNDVI